MEWRKTPSHFAKCRAFLVLSLLLILLLTGCGAGAPKEQIPAEEQTPVEEQVSAYIIADYYNADGSFSALALALEETEAGRALDAVQGERFIVGDHEFMVEADSFTFMFYTHPSVESAVEWWNDYFEVAADNGIVTVIR